MHELLEFFRLVSTKLFDGGLLLLLFNVGILLGLGSARKSLPRKRAAQEVENNVTNGFQVVSSGLLITEMGVDGGIPGGSGQVLAISEWDVLTVGRLETLGETEINDVDSVLSLVVASNKEVIRFDVTMNDAFVMDDFDPLDHLNCDV